MSHKDTLASNFLLMFCSKSCHSGISFDATGVEFDFFSVIAKQEEDSDQVSLILVKDNISAHSEESESFPVKFSSGSF